MLEKRYREKAETDTVKILPGQSEGTGAFTACSEASFLTYFDIFYYVFHTWVSLCFFIF